MSTPVKAYSHIVEAIDSMNRRILEIRASNKEKTGEDGSAGWLDSLEGEMESIGKELKKVRSELRARPLVSLATRTARHFFTEGSTNGFAARVIDELIEEVGATSGAMILFRGDHYEQAEVVSARDAHGENIEHDPHLSRTILAQIAAGQDAVLIQNAVEDDFLKGKESVQKLHLRSVMAIPLRFQDYLAGAICLENRDSGGVFGCQDLELLRAIGGLTAVYLNARLRLDTEVEAREAIYDELKGNTRFDGLVGTSGSMVSLIQRVEQVGPTEATVFIQGENGTGKELIARAIHRTSARSNKPLVVVNCAAIPENLLESEFFGTERGAFTGAVFKKGRIETADGGTLFLDEIGELSKPLQAKLLRFLQERTFERVGGTRSIEVDVRLVAATNRDIQSMVRRGEFREDLYYRLWVVPLEVPALRDRSEDVPLLVDHFIRVYCLKWRKRPLKLESEVYAFLKRYAWPGNIRELENLVQRLVVEVDERVTLYDLPEELRPKHTLDLDLGRNDVFQALLDDVPVDYEGLKRRRQDVMELAGSLCHELDVRFVEYALRQTGQNISKAAARFGMHRTLIHKVLREKKERETNGTTLTQVS